MRGAAPNRAGAAPAALCWATVEPQRMRTCCGDASAFECRPPEPHVASCDCPPQIHWFSIINSCVTVLLLTGFLATILMRVLKNDFVKFSRDDETGAALKPPAPAPRALNPTSLC